MLPWASPEGTHPTCTHAPIPYRNTGITPYLLGDSGYKLTPTIITPYSGNDEAADGIDHIRRFNFSHSSQRMCVERAFGHLNMVFRVLSDGER